MKSFRSQFPANLISNILYFIVNLAIGIWLIPYYIRNLGVGSYGLIPLATSITQYAALFTMALSGGTSRFLTIDLQQGELERANRTFNTAFWGLVAIGLLLTPLLLLLSWYVPVLFKIPPGETFAAQCLFAGASFTFLVTTLSSTLDVSTYAYNRLDLRNAIQVVNLLSRTALLLLFFNLFHPSLMAVAASMLLGALVSTGFSWHIWRKLTPTLRFCLSSFDRSRLRDLLGMGGWLVVNHIGYLLFLQIDLIVVNLLFGPFVAGRYASILQWNSLIRSMAGVLAGVLGPMLMIRYAQGRLNDLETISTLSVKLLGLSLALPIGLACGFARPLLLLWLGPQFVGLVPLLQIMLIHLTINLSVLPLFNINVCYNRVRIPGLVTLVLGALNFLLAISLPFVGSLGFYGVALAGMIVLTLKNAFFTPWYAAKVQGISPRHYFAAMFPGFGASILLALGCLLWDRFLPVSSWGDLFTTSLLLCLVFCVVIWKNFFTSSERELLLLVIIPTKKSIRQNII